MLLCTTVMIAVFAYTGRSAYFIYKRRWPNLAIAVTNLLVGLACVAAAFVIDAPTLLYMT